jgi:hypothetical protein
MNLADATTDLLRIVRNSCVFRDDRRGGAQMSVDEAREVNVVKT